MEVEKQQQIKGESEDVFFCQKKRLKRDGKSIGIFF